MRLILNNWDEHINKLNDELISLQADVVNDLASTQTPDSHESISSRCKIAVNIASLRQRCVEYWAISKFEWSWLIEYKKILIAWKEQFGNITFVKKHLEEVNADIKAIKESKAQLVTIRALLKKLMKHISSKSEPEFVPTEGAFSLPLVDFHLFLTKIKLHTFDFGHLPDNIIGTIHRELDKIKKERKKAADIKYMLSARVTELSSKDVKDEILNGHVIALQLVLQKYIAKLNDFDTYTLRLKEHALFICNNQLSVQEPSNTFRNYHRLPLATQLKPAETFNNAVRTILQDFEKKIKQADKPCTISAEIFEKQFSHLCQDIESKSAETLYAQIQTSIRAFNKMSLKPDLIVREIKQPLIQACIKFKTSYNKQSDAVKTTNDEGETPCNNTKLRN